MIRTKVSRKVQLIIPCSTAADSLQASVASSKGSSLASSVVDEDWSPSNVATPSTPFSPTPLSRHPSDLNKIHRCTFNGCKRSYNRPAKLEEHVRSHTNTRLFICPHSPCTKDFLRDSHLKQHIKSAHSDVRDYHCNQDGCQKSFLTATRLKRHQAAHDGREKFRCMKTGCGKTFRKHSTLQAHIANFHDGKKPFICAFLNEDGRRCGTGFDTVWKLRDHCGRMHEMKQILCTICLQSTKDDLEDLESDFFAPIFTTHAALQEHIAVEHPPTCSQCGASCMSQGALNSHIEIYHGALTVDDRKTHHCQESSCGASFTKKGNLNVHTRTVHGQRRFVCGSEQSNKLNKIDIWDGSDACGDSFKTKANLENHIRSAHLGLDRMGNSKAKRKEKRAMRDKSSTLTRLTGSGYDETSERHIVCLVQDCPYRFFRDYDHEMHLMSHHGLADLEIQAMHSSRNLSLHRRPTFHECWNLATADDMAADEALDLHFEDDLHMNGVDGSVEAAASMGKDFWLGDRSYDVVDDMEWIHDEDQMQRLIDHDVDPDPKSQASCGDATIDQTC